MQRGTLVILVIVLLAASLGGFALWFKYQQGRRCLQLWGSESANLIRHAPEVELLRLQPHVALQGAETVNILGAPYQLASRREISGVPGLVHARHSLIVDENFLWNEAGGDDPASWEFAVRFRAPGRQATVAFAPRSGRVCLVEAGRSAVLIQRLAEAWQLRSRTWLDGAQYSN